MVRYTRLKSDDGEGYGNLSVAFTMLKMKNEAYTVWRSRCQILT